MIGCVIIQKQILSIFSSPQSCSPESRVKSLRSWLCCVSDSELSDQLSIETCEIKPGVVLDFGEEGQLVGIALDYASRFINLSKIEMDSLPLRTLAFT